MHKKSDLRKQMLAKRQAIAAEEQARHELDIVENIRSMSCFARATSMCLYMPIKGEVSLLSLWTPEDRLILFPKVIDEHIAFSSAASKQDFVEGAFGIPEPVSDKYLEINEVDVIFVPGVAFDRYGHRLGYGKGYYDRLIGKNPDKIFIGVCLDEFCLDRLPVDPWDKQVDFVVTQAGIYKK